MNSRRSRYPAVARVGATFLVLLLAATAVAVASVRTITRTNATAVATAISLRQSDLPAFTQERNPITSQQQRLDAQATACYGGVAVGEAYANTQSPAFVSSGQSVIVASSVEILPSEALVARDLAAVERPHALPCFVSEFTSGVRASLPKADKLSSVTAARLPAVVRVSGPTVDLRLRAVISEHEGATTVSAPVFIDQIGFTDGQAEVALEVQTTSVAPSISLERRLAGLLVARARAAIGR